MKKIFLTLTFLGAFCLFAKAQFSFSAGATYTKYGGDIKKASPGAHLRGIYYATEKSGLGLGFTYSLPLKTTYDDGEFVFNRTSNFMSISLLGTYHLIGTYDSDFSLYFPVGGSYQIGTSKYSFAASQSNTSITIEDEKLTGLTINASIGLQYRIGNPYVFAEAGFGLATGTATYNTRDGGTPNNNPAPGSTVLQIGIRIPFGGGVGGGVY
ncbi:MAG: hypothetical protein EOO98_04100 [Pedobacter sp.]|nr:MAG: hypothetical protein EOO98_04100 [Pedobacter sp.]